VATARRKRRRRGVLALVGVAAAAAALAGIVHAVDPGTEHGKVLKGRAGEVTVP
jgi:ferric-dicitrate binding protein FerR (iron transport regulator)